MKVRMVGDLWNTELWMGDGDPMVGPILGWSHDRGRDPLAKGLLIRIADVMADVEVHDLKVDRVFVVRRGIGHVIVAKVGPGKFFHENGKRTNFSSSTSCPVCGGQTRTANPLEGHLDECPMKTIIEVMES